MKRFIKSKRPTLCRTRENVEDWVWGILLSIIKMHECGKQTLITRLSYRNGYVCRQIY